ncbi:hypothetical protein DMJ13_20155 [halophilic archaeon]|nr:hypothetical protein DMJ13_20155 [halophilic archaeon]
MAATTQPSQPRQPESEPQPKDVQKTFWTNSDGDAQLEALAALNDCSQGAVLRKLIDDAFTEQFDDLDPAHIEHGRVSVEELQALANDETTVEELDLKSNPGTSIGEHEPDSYYLTVTPEDLADPGPELDWETLRDAVKNPEDGGYWNDNLEVHPSRVGENTLKASHRPAARILTAIARSKAYENEIIPHETIDELVDSYCLHLTNRVTDDEQERGEEHIRETYTDLITDLLYENPSPTVVSYYCSRDQLQARLQTELDTAHNVAERADTITDFDVWKPDDVDDNVNDNDNNEDETTEAELRLEWKHDLGHWFKDLVRAKHIGRTYATELRRGNYDLDHVDDPGITACDAMHNSLHTALNAFDDLPTDVRTDLIEQLDDPLVAVIADT